MKSIKFIAAAAAVLALTGCGNYATKADLAEVNARTVAAGEQAVAANKLASQALERAKVAQASADLAIQCCTEQKARLDSMFEKAMHK